MSKLIASLLVIAFGVILLVHLIPLCIWGEVKIYEYSRAIAITETIMSVAILLFGIGLFVRLLRR